MRSDFAARYEVIVYDFWEFHDQASRMVLDFLEQHPLAGRASRD